MSSNSNKKTNRRTISERTNRIKNAPIEVLDAKTTPHELVKEFLINFFYGLVGNSITVFAAKEFDVAIFVNFIIYYLFLSVIINRNKYETTLGKYLVFPGAAAMGAFSGYKIALFLSSII